MSNNPTSIERLNRFKFMLVRAFLVALAWSIFFAATTGVANSFATVSAKASLAAVNGGAVEMIGARTLPSWYNVTIVCGTILFIMWFLYYVVKSWEVQAAYHKPEETY